MKKTKKLLVILLTMAMVLGLMPVSAFAEGEEHEEFVNVSVAVYGLDDSDMSHEQVVQFPKGRAESVNLIADELNVPEGKVINFLEIGQKSYPNHMGNVDGTITFDSDASIAAHVTDAVKAEYITDSGDTMVDYGGKPFSEMNFAKEDMCTVGELASFAVAPEGKVIDYVLVNGVKYEPGSSDYYNTMLTLNESIKVIYHLESGISINFKSNNGSKYDCVYVIPNKEIEIYEILQDIESDNEYTLIDSVVINGKEYSSENGGFVERVSFDKETTIQLNWIDAVKVTYVSDIEIPCTYVPKNRNLRLYELLHFSEVQNGKVLHSVVINGKTYVSGPEDYDKVFNFDKDIEIKLNWVDAVKVIYSSDVPIEISESYVARNTDLSLYDLLNFSFEQNGKILDSVVIEGETYYVGDDNSDIVFNLKEDLGILLNWTDAVYVKYNIGEGGTSDGFYDPELGPGRWVVKGNPVGAEEFAFDVIANEGKVIDKILLNGKVIYSEWDEYDSPAVVFENDSVVDITFADAVKVNVDANGKEAIGSDGEPLEYFYAIKGRPVSVYRLDRINWPEGYVAILDVNGVEYPDNMEKVTLTEETTVKYRWEKVYNVFIDLNGAVYRDEWQEGAEEPWMFDQRTYCVGEFYMSDILIVPEGKKLVAVEIDGKRYYNLDTEFKLDKDIDVKYIWETVKVDKKKPVIENKVSEEAIVKGSVIKTIPEDKPLSVEVKTGTVEYNEAAMKVIKDKVADGDRVIVKLDRTDVKEAGNKKQQAAIKTNKGLEVFEITLEIIKADGTKKAEIKDFNGGKVTVTVDFPNPEKKELQVYRVEDNGTLTPMETTYKNGKLTWVTDGHSYYMVAEAKAEEITPVVKPGTTKPTVTPDAEKSEADKDAAPKTGDEANMGMWVILLMTAAAAVLVVKKESEK